MKNSFQEAEPGVNTIQLKNGHKFNMVIFTGSSGGKGGGGGGGCSGGGGCGCCLAYI